MRSMATALLFTIVSCSAAMAAEKSGNSNDPNVVAARAELYRLIHEVRGVKFGEQAGTKTADKPQGAKSDAAEAARVQSKAAADANSAAKTAEKSAQQAARPPEQAPIVQDPNSIASPFEMAESLYRVGRYKEAAACYRVSLARATDKKHAMTEADQAWVLFQVGNCFAKTDPAEALKVYRQLITDFPASEWTPIAVSREQLVQWYLTNKITPKAEKTTVGKQQ
jgi:tetratricopeptide (TPR) repeat protein